MLEDESGRGPGRLRAALRGGAGAGAGIGPAVRRRLGGYARVAAERDAAILLWSGLASEIGDWFNTVALVAVSYDLGDGALAVGGMLAVRALPRLLFQIPAGALVDRWHGRRVLFASHLLMALVATAFVLLLAAPSLWLLYALVFLLETGNVVAFPAYRAQLAAETPPEALGAVNGVLGVGMTVAQFVGPLLGGLLLAVTGPVAVFVANGLTFMAVALAVTRLRGGLAGRPAATPDDAPPGPDPSPVPGAAGGYRTLLARRDLLVFLACVSAASLLVRGAIALFVLRAEDLGLGDGGVGYFYAAVAVGSIVGGAVVGTGSHATPRALSLTAAGFVASAAGLLLFATTPAVGVAFAALLVSGFGVNTYEVAGLTYFQHQLPEAVAGRFFSALLFALGIGAPVGALLAPLLEAELGVGAALLVLALPTAGLAAALVAVGTRRPAAPA